MSDFMLRYKLESPNECAQIEPVDIREDIMEETWSEAKYVHHIFSSFVVGMVFLGDITGSGIKGMREKSPSLLNCTTARFPVLIITKYCPVPGFFVVGSATSNLTSPEVDQEVTDVGNEVHDIGSHAQGNT
jgi:hypothetical protein